MMIDHKNKCIFIHIPGCAGSSIELSLVKKDWWLIDKKTKHIFASDAKKVYSKYWDDYFKFTIIRNPWDRTKSLARFPNFYKVKIEDGKIDLSGFKKRINRYGFEFDHRSISTSKDNPIKNSIYLNILDEPLDFIGRFEDLKGSWETICQKIGKNIPLERKNPFDHKKYNHKAPKINYKDCYNKESQQEVAKLYKEDIKRFNYNF